MSTTPYTPYQPTPLTSPCPSVVCLSVTEALNGFLHRSLVGEFPTRLHLVRVFALELQQGVAPLLQLAAEESNRATPSSSTPTSDPPSSENSISTANANAELERKRRVANVALGSVPALRSFSAIPLISSPVFSSLYFPLVFLLFLPSFSNHLFNYLFTIIHQSNHQFDTQGYGDTTNNGSLLYVDI